MAKPVEPSDGDQLRIRRFVASDADAVWELHNLALYQVGAHPGNGPWDDDLHTVEVDYLANQGEFLIGECGGVLVAMGALLRQTPRIAEIKRMRVHPDHQRRGFGRAILVVLEVRARELGYRELFLETTVQQTAAQALYEGFGFREIRRYQLGPFWGIAYEKPLA